MSAEKPIDAQPHIWKNLSAAIKKSRRSDHADPEEITTTDANTMAVISRIPTTVRHSMDSCHNLPESRTITFSWPLEITA